MLQKLEKYCIGETDEIYKRYCFNTPNQEPNESVDAYLTALRTLATCNFGTLESRLMRDRRLQKLITMYAQIENELLWRNRIWNGELRRTCMAER